ncbi:MAG: S8 family serine peptidase, partial [Planctomycetes bacterium]|nr:S8 family serine peptidase [Planctomycetota bacterium]
VVAAAGNGGYDGGVGIPACVTEAIGVGATYDDTYGYDVGWDLPCTDSSPSVDDIACFSNRGELLDLLAPGAIITSARLGGSYEQGAGTSAATPHVAGAAAVLFDIMGMSTSPAAIRDRLRRTGVQIVDPITDVATPRIDLVRAMNETPTSGPDLVVTAVAADVTAALVGDPVEVRVTVENQGDSGSGACTAVVVVSGNRIASPQDRAVASVAIPALGLGGSHASDWVSGAVPAVMPGQYWIAAYVDSGYVVTEEDETNNGATGAGLTVEGMSSYVMSSSIPASMLKGQTHAMSVVMWNDGTAAWTAADGFALKAVSPEGTARWGISTVGLPGGRTVNAGGDVTFTFNVTAPGEVGLHPCHWRMARGDVYFGEVATGATKTRLVDDATAGQGFAAVSGEWAAYEDHRELHYGSVSVTNLTTMWSMMLPDELPFDIDPVTQKPTNAGYEEFLLSYHVYPDISGPWVTWMVDDYSAGGLYYYQVVAYNVLTPSLLPRRITHQAAQGWLPSIDGNLVVWEDYRNDPDGRADPDYFLNDDSDIYIYDITTDTSYPLCTAAGPQLAPRISGDLVVWEDWRDITPDVQSDIHLYDLSVDTDGDETPNWKDPDRPDPDPAEMMVTDTWWSEQYPDISGRRIVWLDLRRDTGTGTAIIDIYLRDLEGPTTATAVATDPATYREQPRIDGTKVTWTDWRQANPDAYWMDVATGAGGPIGGSSAAEGWSDVSGDRVIYEKHRATVGEPGDEWYVYNVWVQDMLQDGSVGVHTFTDVPSDFWAWQYVEAAVENGVVHGFPEGTYQPSWIVSRDQMAVYVARA